VYRERAGFGERLVAYTIDSVVVGLIIAIPVGCVAVAATYLGDRESITGVAVNLAIILLVLLLAAVGSILYYGLAWSRSGQTLGKKVMGLQVVTGEGDLPGFWRSVGRAVIGYGLSSVAFDLGFLWMLWDEAQQTWHDKLFDTFVVKV
jgi:uncharacterized RDD family membrane protein YckC